MLRRLQQKIDWRRVALDVIYSLYVGVLWRFSFPLWTSWPRHQGPYAPMDYANLAFLNSLAFERYGIPPFEIPIIVLFLFFFLLLFIDVFSSVREAKAYYGLLLCRHGRRRTILRWFIGDGCRVALCSAGRYIGLFLLLQFAFCCFDPLSVPPEKGFSNFILPFITFYLRLSLYLFLVYVFLTILQLAERGQAGYLLVSALTLICVVLSSGIPEMVTLTFSEDVTGGWPFALVMLGLNGAAVWLLRRQLKRGELNE